MRMFAYSLSVALLGLSWLSLNNVRTSSKVIVEITGALVPFLAAISADSLSSAGVRYCPVENNSLEWLT